MASLPICDTLKDLPLSRESHDCKHRSCMGKEHIVSNDNKVYIAIAIIYIKHVAIQAGHACTSYKD